MFDICKKCNKIQCTQYMDKRIKKWTCSYCSNINERKDLSFEKAAALTLNKILLKLDKLEKYLEPSHILEK